MASKLAGYLGDGVWSARLVEPAKADEVVHTLDGPVFSSPTKYTVRVGPGEHLIDPVAQYMNHSCSPTFRIDGRNVIALGDYEAGAEVTFDYATTEEPSLAAPFVCDRCGLLFEGDRPPCKSEAA